MSSDPTVSLTAAAASALKSVNLGHSAWDSVLKTAANIALSSTSPWLELEASSTPSKNAKLLELDDEISVLKKKLHEQTIALNSEKADKRKHEKANRDLQKSLEQLSQKQELAFLLTRVSTEAHEALLTNSTFRNQFFSSEDRATFVVSVDIRRSTELMLKARRPDLFAKFISELCTDLEVIIKQSGGVFDKFTGDGILAFFPRFLQWT
ncbi:adenylate/guanylate cyclase domain-containing protein [Brevifollis gellanilyticus]|uniref:adenylate/guanylate cyclase domain-containing protein n=1 Tax=Brevifollis gellanilyticus TaxID=748831 RepID=UPI00147899D9|nr:adenylate/guanylate cyclase domain-containing protein [Brevifollis gellanilyticus]